MNLREFIVLEVLNIASTDFMRDGLFRASAEECSNVFQTDLLFAAERRAAPELVNARVMAGVLSRLRYGPRRYPLVHYNRRKREWNLSHAGVKALGA